MTQLTLPAPTIPSGSRASAVQSASQMASQPYLLGPWLDLIFLANAYWPVLFMVAYLGGTQAEGRLLFWQVYFITAPHRWITLLLVACDRNRTRGREGRFLGLTCVIISGCLFWRAGSSTLLCLGVIDYLWNAWHFASQHHGIHRIYERRCERTTSQASVFTEKLLFRGFLLYVIARVAGFGWTNSEWLNGWRAASLDPFIAIIPAMFLLKQFRAIRAGGRLWNSAYLISVMVLFSALLAAAHWERRTLMIQLALCSAVFHSIEYMGIVTWASTTPSNTQRNDLFGKLARQWGLFLVFFVLFLGLSNYILAHGNPDLWILINLIVAFLHYGFDGMIWKTRPQVRGNVT